MKVGITINNIIRDHTSKLITTFKNYYPEGKIIDMNGKIIEDDYDINEEILINPYDLPSHFIVEENKVNVQDMEIIKETDDEETYFEVLTSTEEDFDIIDFIYNEAAFEVFGRCDEAISGCINQLSMYATENNLNLSLTNLESKKSKGGTLMFLSIKGFDFKEIQFPSNYNDMWDKYDVIVTDNPKVINSKPEGKKVIKVNKWYNAEYSADETISNVLELTTNKYFKND